MGYFGMRTMFQCWSPLLLNGRDRTAGLLVRLVLTLGGSSITFDTGGVFRWIERSTQGLPVGRVSEGARDVDAAGL